MKNTQTIFVNLRITGIYFGRNFAEQDGAILVEVKKEPTVFDVLKAASIKANSGQFNNIEFFAFEPANPPINPVDDPTDYSIQAIYVKYINDVRIVPLKPQLNRLKGLYSLIDPKNGNLTMQYYIHDRNLTQWNTNNFSKKFNETPDVEIKDGYTIIIRQVNIKTAPDDEMLSIALTLNNEINTQTL